MRNGIISTTHQISVVDMGGSYGMYGEEEKFSRAYVGKPGYRCLYNIKMVLNTEMKTINWEQVFLCIVD